MKNLIIASLLTLVTSISFSAQAQEGGKGKRTPPAEAFTACSGLSEGTSCSFSGDRGDVTGMCKAPREGEGELACAPERGGKGGGNRPERS